MQDARYSQENKNWSELIAIPDSNLRNEYLINNHPVLINALIDKTRIAFDELNMFSAKEKIETQEPKPLESVQQM